MTDSLGTYGYNFQVKLLSSLLTDTLFYKQIVSILKETYFENASAQWILIKLNEYFSKYNTTPTPDYFRTEIQNIDKSQELLKMEVIKLIIDVYNNIESTDLQYIKDKSLTFCKNKELKAAIEKSVAYLQEENFEAIKKVIDDALKAGISLDIGLDYKKDFEDRYRPDMRNPIATPWSVINGLVSGGLAEGELGAVVAPSGFGKSWILTIIALHAAKLGKKVIYYTLELKDTLVERRADANLYGVDFNDVDMYKEAIKKMVDELPGNILTKQYPTKSASVQTLRGHIAQCQSVGFDPDMIIVDYADLLRGSGKEKRYELESIYEELRGLGGELKIPVWTASQTNREGLKVGDTENKIITSDKIGEAYNKVFVVDLMFSFYSTLEDEAKGVARVHIMKNRIGKSRDTFFARVNLSYGKLEMYSPKSIEGQKIKELMEDDEFLKAVLRDNFEQLKGTVINGDAVNDAISDAVIDTDEDQYDLPF